MREELAGGGAGEEDTTSLVQNWAFLTFDILAKTLSGVTSPTTVTFFAAKSMLKDVTPALHTHPQRNPYKKFCLLNFPFIFAIILSFHYSPTLLLLLLFDMALQNSL